MKLQKHKVMDFKADANASYRSAYKKYQENAREANQELQVLMSEKIKTLRDQGASIRVIESSLKKEGFSTSRSAISRILKKFEMNPRTNGNTTRFDNNELEMV
jgi:hypothetical protein